MGLYPSQPLVAHRRSFRALGWPGRMGHQFQQPREQRAGVVTCSANHARIDSGIGRGLCEASSIRTSTDLAMATHRPDSNSPCPSMQELLSTRTMPVPTSTIHPVQLTQIVHGDSPSRNNAVSSDTPGMNYRTKCVHPVFSAIPRKRQVVHVDGPEAQ